MIHTGLETHCVRKTLLLDHEAQHKAWCFLNSLGSLRVARSSFSLRLGQFICNGITYIKFIIIITEKLHGLIMFPQY